MSTIDVSVKTGYQPPSSSFVEDNKAPLIDLHLTDSTELWLIQWPINQPPDFDGQQLSLNLNSDGHLGNFEGSSGKLYDVVIDKCQGPETTVFLSSPSEARIAGKISRRVSLIHYPEPSELKKRNIINLSHSARSSVVTSSLSGGRHLPTPTRSIKPGATPSSRNKNPLPESAKPLKRKRAHEPIKPTDNSAQNSGRGNSGVTTVESADEKKSKKKKIES
ncbi:hypothetical protein ABFX02_03G033700 [Erythranthe guttata]